MQGNTIDKIVEWLKKTMSETRTRGFVVGLSGGLDSAVCAALIKRTTDDCLGLILPIESEVKDLDDASAEAARIGIRIEYIDLTAVYNNLKRLLPDGDCLAAGNIKARLRMVVLYYYANLNNYLVCGTGNKTELTLGYFTKYGDGACDVLPIGDLYKSQVRELAGSLGISEEIIKKVPSAGLWKGQTDEGEIGCSYEEMDKTLQEIEKGKVGGGIGEKLHEMIKKSEHKRTSPKICYIKSQSAIRHIV